MNTSASYRCSKLLRTAFEKQDFGKHTIGILLCADKNDAVVKITLPENNTTIIASKYQLYLPTEQQLIDEVRKEIQKLDIEKPKLYNSRISITCVI